MASSSVKANTFSPVDSKHALTATAREFPLEFDNEAADVDRQATKSTLDDAFQMQRMGKKQEFKREFKLANTVSLVIVALAGWQLTILLLTPGLEDGGVPGLLYTMIAAFIGIGPVYLSMAEMASMAPISGAQYHWVSEFAPERYQKILSYITGWTSTIAWQAGNGIGPLFTGTLIQTIILLADSEYSFPNWQGALLSMFFCGVTYVGNVYCYKLLPHWQNAVMILVFISFLTYCVPIWVRAPKISLETAFTDFQNFGGWSSMTLAVLAGQLTAFSAPTGVDTAVHMAEDVRDASRSIPITMLVAYVLDVLFIFIAVATACFGMTDVKAALNDPTTYPVIWVLRQTMSNGWIIAVLTLIVLVLIAGNVSYMAAVNRDLFAFARDRGLPGSRWISKVDPIRHIPVNAARVSTVTGILFSLIYIGSPIAVYAIASLSTVALLQCYATSISCFLWRRIYHPETLPPTRFSLGRWGIAINVYSVMYCLWGFFWCFWPQVVNPDAANMNWAGPIYLSVLLIALVYYFVRARHTYEGPVVHIRGRGGRVEIQMVT